MVAPRQWPRLPKHIPTRYPTNDVALVTAGAAGHQQQKADVALFMRHGAHVIFGPYDREQAQTKTGRRPAISANEQRREGLGGVGWGCGWAGRPPTDRDLGMAPATRAANANAAGPRLLGRQ